MVSIILDILPVNKDKLHMRKKWKSSECFSTLQTPCQGNAFYLRFSFNLHFKNHGKNHNPN